MTGKFCIFRTINGNKNVGITHIFFHLLLYTFHQSPYGKNPCGHFTVHAPHITCDFMQKIEVVSPQKRRRLRPEPQNGWHRREQPLARSGWRDIIPPCLMDIHENCKRYGSILWGASVRKALWSLMRGSLVSQLTAQVPAFCWVSFSFVRRLRSIWSAKKLTGCMRPCASKVRAANDY